MSVPPFVLLAPFWMVLAIELLYFTEQGQKENFEELALNIILQPSSLVPCALSILRVWFLDLSWCCLWNPIRWAIDLLVSLLHRVQTLVTCFLLDAFTLLFYLRNVAFGQARGHLFTSLFFMTAALLGRLFKSKAEVFSILFLNFPVGSFPLLSLLPPLP